MRHAPPWERSCRKCRRPTPWTDESAVRWIVEPAKPLLSPPSNLDIHAPATRFVSSKRFVRRQAASTLRRRSVLVRDDRAIGDVDEKAALDDARHSVQAHRRDRVGAPIRFEMEVDDQIAFIRLETARRPSSSRRSVVLGAFDVAALRASVSITALSGFPPEGRDFDRQRKRRQASSTRLEASAMTIMRSEAGGHDLLDQERAAASLN